MTVESVDPVHREVVAAHTPPTVFGAVRGLGRLGAFALPSEMISIASLATAVVVFATVTVRESQRFFFRMPAWWVPLLFSLPAVLLCLLIAWRGSKRPGPTSPRWWVMGLIVVNAMLVLAELAAGLLPRVPGWLSDPFPLHALAVSGAVGSVVLLPRLIRAHPLHYRVQLLAPLSLGGAVAIAWILSSIYIDHEIDAEKHTLETMAAGLDEAKAGLLQAVHFDYTATDIDSGDEDMRRTEATLAGMVMPALLPLPDSRRWQAAGVLERSGNLPPGRLERAVRDLIDAVTATTAPDALPVLRVGRFQWNGDSAAYVPTPEADFERAADLILRYHATARTWLPTLDRLQPGVVAGQARSAQQEISDRIARLRRHATTAWVAMHMTKGKLGVDPPGGLTEVLGAPLSEVARPIGDMAFWMALPWRRTPSLRGDDGSCQQVRPRVTNRQLIPAPDDLLTEEQRFEQQEGFATYYIGQRFDALGMVRCFAYHPPFGAATDPDDLIVIELRLTYAVHRELRAAAPCLGLPCGSGPVLPASTTPSTVVVLIDIPSGIAEQGYSDAVSGALQAALLDKGLTVKRTSEAQPDGRRALRFELSRGAK